MDLKRYDPDCLSDQGNPNSYEMRETKTGAFVLVVDVEREIAAIAEKCRKLAEHVQHAYDCPRLLAADPNVVCNCGLSDLLAETEATDG